MALNGVSSSFFAGALFSVGCILWKVRRMLRAKIVCTVSAPGKILVAGGYAILDDENKGLAIAATSRFYTTVLAQKSSSHHAVLVIEVESPQFGDFYEFHYDWNRRILLNGCGKHNDFIGKCLSLALAFAFYFCENHVGTEDLKRIQKMKIKLRADNDFYSRIRDLKSKGLPLTSESLKIFPKFYAPRDANGATISLAKTGLGSSAALTASLVGALLHSTGVIDLNLPDDEMLRVVHNLSQLAHALAQGKIGSGFDVSAAIYGSQLYGRFSAANVDLSLLQDDGSCDDEMLFYTVMQHNIWNQTMVKLQLPPKMNLVLGDVCGGSSSTSMARAVLQWRKDNPVESGRLWKRLVAANNLICDYVLDLNECALSNAELYDRVLSKIGDSHYSQWNFDSDAAGKEIIDKLLGLKKHFSIARQALKQIGEEAGVEIEPDQQTSLVNATEDLPGVLAAGVPGAGGVDAVFAITTSDIGRKRIEALWSSYTDNDSVVCPLLLRSADLHSGIKLECNID